jgi:hypothetical protein
MASQIYDPNSQTYNPGSTGFGTATPYNPTSGAVGSGAGGINTNNGMAPGAMSGPATAPTLSAPSQSGGTYSNGMAPYAPGGLQPGQGSPGDVGFNGNVPGAGENVSASYLSYYGANGTPTTSNDAQQAYTDFRNSTPANMNPYYDNAERNATNDINKQMAARGSFGSSNAVGVLSNATTNLRAQQAKDEAQYGLSRYGLEGQLASGADSSSGAQSQNDLNWMRGISDLGFANQKEGTARYELGNEDAFKAASTMSGIQGSVGAAEIANDQALLEQMLQAGSGATADQVTAMQNKLSAAQAQSNQNTAATTGALQTGASALSAYV